MGSISYTEWTCDRCGATRRVEHVHVENPEDSGWRGIEIGKPDLWDAEDESFILCPECAPVVSGAIVAACTGGKVVVDGKRVIVEL